MLGVVVRVVVDAAVVVGVVVHVRQIPVVVGVDVGVVVVGVVVCAVVVGVVVAAVAGAGAAKAAHASASASSMLRGRVARAWHAGAIAVVVASGGIIAAHAVQSRAALTGFCFLACMHTRAGRSGVDVGCHGEWSAAYTHAAMPPAARRQGIQIVDVWLA